MLRCPKCNRTYPDDMQKFCTHDGGRLAPDIDKPKSFDPNATVTGNASAFDIQGEPSSGLPTVHDLGATIATPPSVPLPPAPGSTPSTSGFRSSETSPTSFSETTRLGQQPPGAPGQYPTVTAPPQTTPPPGPPVNVPGQPPSPSVGPTGVPVSSTPLPPKAATAVSQSAQLPGVQKKSKLGLTLAVVGVLLLIVIVGGGVAVYFTYFKGPRRGRGVSETPVLKSNTNSTGTTTNAAPPTDTITKTGEAPANSLKFENTSSSLDGKLAEHYVDFYFYYPNAWQKNPKAGVKGAANFVEVERKLPPDFTQENVTVSWYESKGTVGADLAGKLPALIRARNANLASTLPEYQKVSEGKTTVNGIEGYEFRFKAVSRGTDKGDIFIWGRVVFLPPGDVASSKGVTLYMFTTSLAPELKSVDDVGVKGELPVILNSFTLGKS